MVKRPEEEVIMAKLWQKPNGNLNGLVEKFETADDLIYDNYLAYYDCIGSIAHAKMLTKIGLLSDVEYVTLQKAFKEIFNQISKDNFNLELGDEDIHTKIENELYKRAGESGKKIHTGRSRNDQVLLDIRLLTRQRILELKGLLLEIVEAFTVSAEKYADIPMPGYTHMQKAMSSSVGLWLGAYAESLLDNVTLLDQAYDLNDQSPLGSGAGFGVDLPLDRQYVADLLGFKKVQSNSIYCQNSRGKIESVVVFALMQIHLDLSKFASDIMLFTTSEFNFFKVSEDIYTGSSIMPQKKNIDLAELIRSKVYVIEGYFLQIFNVTTNLPSGYNRDLQDTKKPYIDSLDLTSQVLEVSLKLIKSLYPNKEVLIKSMTPELYATSLAYDYVKKGMSFRDAYKKVGSELDLLQSVDPEKHVKTSSHLGSTGNLNLGPLKTSVQKQIKLVNDESARIAQTVEKLIL